MTVELMPCPFCGSTPSMSEPEWRDDNRYVGMDISCCTKMEISIGWNNAKGMSKDQLAAKFEEYVVREWNEPLIERARERDAALLRLVNKDYCYGSTEAVIAELADKRESGDWNPSL